MSAQDPLRAALEARLPVKDISTKSEGGIDVTLAVHYGTRADLIDSIVEIVAALPRQDEPGLREALERDQANTDIDLHDLLRHTYAALAARQDEPGLDAAWAAAEAALPDGYYISNIRRRHPTGHYSASATLAGDISGANYSGFGGTPGDALRALAARLRGSE